MIKIEDKRMCSGCHACDNICPKKAISMDIDEEGFWYPNVDKDKCVNCNLCEDVCPIINNKDFVSIKKAYGCYNLDEDIRLKSSSGGVFSLLASSVIAKNGVVFGAKFDENFNVVHDYAETIEELSVFRGSKYVQSNIGENFKIAKEFLKSGRLVLFSGTPCQIGGFKAYLRKEYDNLITVDLICHGVPSPMIWQKYINELSNGKKLTAMTFRDKSKGWKNGVLKYTFDDRSEIKEEYGKSVYIKGFIKNCYLRPSCYDCHFKTLDRCSDLTLGDFWGVEDLLPDIDLKQGVSLVLGHTKKGIKLMKNLNEKIYLKEINIDDSIKFNSCAIQSVSLPKAREKFFSSINNLSIGSAIEKALYKSRLMLAIDKYNILLKKIKIKLKNKVSEIYYSVTDYILKTFFQLKIKTIDESIDYLVNNKVSVCRFGDGEFKIINSVKIAFQESDIELSKRLVEVLKANHKDLMICIPGTLISTDDMISNSKTYWDNHLKYNRVKWYKNLSLNKTYFNTQMTRLYIDYTDKSLVKGRFDKIKSLWNGRDIVIIEGEYTKLGIGNDLFKNTNSISRIIAPSKNAFDKYDIILEYAKEIDKDKLILIALGPTATILAYDLYQLGYQAVDVGHIDIEYEWFLKQTNKKIPIKNKYVNEVIEGRVIESYDNKEYLDQVLYKVGGI